MLRLWTWSTLSTTATKTILWTINGISISIGRAIRWVGNMICLNSWMFHQICWAWKPPNVRSHGKQADKCWPDKAHDDWRYMEERRIGFWLFASDGISNRCKVSGTNWPSGDSSSVRYLKRAAITYIIWILQISRNFDDWRERKSRRVEPSCVCSGQSNHIGVHPIKSGIQFRNSSTAKTIFGISFTVDSIRSDPVFIVSQRHMAKTRIHESRQQWQPTFSANSNLWITLRAQFAILDAEMQLPKWMRTLFVNENANDTKKSEKIK